VAMHDLGQYQATPKSSVTCDPGVWGSLDGSNACRSSVGERQMSRCLCRGPDGSAALGLEQISLGTNCSCPPGERDVLDLPAGTTPSFARATKTPLLFCHCQRDTVRRSYTPPIEAGYIPVFAAGLCLPRAVPTLRERTELLPAIDNPTAVHAVGSSRAVALKLPFS